MPRAEVVGVPAVAGLTEVTGLTLLLRFWLCDAVAERLVDLRAVGRVVLDAVEVVEVTQPPDTQLAVVVVELVVTRRGALEELEGAPVLVVGGLKVRVVAVLVLLVAEHRDERGMHRLDLLGGRVLSGIAGGCGRATGADIGRLLGPLGGSGLTGDVADCRKDRGVTGRAVRPVVVAT